MPTIVHFEIPVNDVQRAKNFYSNLFCWEFEQLTVNKSEFVIISTKDRRGNTGLSGAMVKKTNQLTLCKLWKLYRC